MINFDLKYNIYERPILSFLEERQKINENFKKSINTKTEPFFNIEEMEEVKNIDKSIIVSLKNNVDNLSFEFIYETLLSINYNLTVISNDDKKICVIDNSLQLHLSNVEDSTFTNFVPQECWEDSLKKAMKNFLQSLNK